MSRYPYAIELFARVFEAQGMEHEAAMKTAELALGVGQAAGMMPHLDMWERDAQIYRLRGQRVTAVAISERFGGMDRVSIYRAMHRHMKRCRSALKAIAA